MMKQQHSFTYHIYHVDGSSRRIKVSDGINSPYGLIILDKDITPIYKGKKFIRNKWFTRVNGIWDEEIPKLKRNRPNIADTLERLDFIDSSSLPAFLPKSYPNWIDFEDYLSSGYYELKVNHVPKKMREEISKYLRKMRYPSPIVFVGS